LIKQRQGEKLKKRKAKVFGRVRDNGCFHSIFECSCGSKDWITEDTEHDRVYVCRKCGERYILVKKPNWHYVIIREAGLESEDSARLN
jgi:DNA-directed RNA polymerase subunit RPC12/RpoP